MNRFLIITLILFPFIFLKSQQIDYSKYECKYMATFLRDTMDVNSKLQEVVVLRIGDDGTSIFKSEFQITRDSILYEESEKVKRDAALGNFTFRMPNLPKSAFRQEVYVKKGKKLLFDYISMDVYAFEPPNKPIWTITNEKKKIAKYHCKKAVGIYGNKNIIAWFTEEIPIPEGPYTFKGLPGLVIEAYDDKQHFHFTLFSLKKWMKPIVPREKNVIFTDYKIFKNKRREYKDDPAMNRVRMGKSNNIPSKEARDNARRVHSKINNFID